ncbi:trans-aconitate 2-methyltransferase [Chthonobacter albigriseus]|uniref:trans-aconitate 2-methyltransferase n=1 Tax=Chthonobacter albigriseus TaxID=1683161 RepID=UPI0015EF34E1|nr:trans-aconitate 2-methyltransferase [Chthonobacter albigriseus]
MSDWSPSSYLTFEDERTRAARDLLAAVPLAEARAVVDVGCGPGNSTELLARRYTEAAVTGFDTSPAMLEAARSRVPSARFVAGDAATWEPDGPVDLFFANAVLQWVPDPLSAMERLVGLLADSGVMAVQMPDNVTEPSHRLMTEAARAGGWGDRLAGAARAPLASVGEIYDRLAPRVRRLEIWHTAYNHALPGPEAVVDFVRSTGLKPFLDRLDAAEQAAYLALYQARIAEAYPRRADGRVLLRFPRVFIVAVR